MRTTSTATTFTVVHTTRYVYEKPVTESHGAVILQPRDTGSQRHLDGGVEISPEPSYVRDHEDVYGNRTGYFAVHEPHTELVVTSRNVVEVDDPGVPTTDLSWEDALVRVDRADDPDLRLARQFLLPSPSVTLGPRLREYAAPSFVTGRPVIAAYEDLVHRIHEEFEFDPSATDVSTPLDEVLEARAGVCQDFAHLTIGCLRSLGLPARYVSGYLETDPPPGKPKLQGADASHAWVSLGVPGIGWVDADPTNDQFLSGRHVTVAWGRDYTDVTPLKGVIYTDGRTEELVVEVDVLRA